jgi:hypothetical protein
MGANFDRYTDLFRSLFNITQTCIGPKSNIQVYGFLIENIAPMGLVIITANELSIWRWSLASKLV